MEKGHDSMGEERLSLDRRMALKGLGAFSAMALSSATLAAVPPQAAGQLQEGEKSGLSLPEQGLEPSRAQCIDFLCQSNQIGRRAMTLGHHPFGALLVAPDQKTVLMTQCNIDTVNHAESTLARMAATNYTAEYLWGCTLYTAVEPCCMCAGTIYWANIGRVVFGMTEEKLLALTGSHHENPTMSVSSHYVFSHGQKAVRLIGPVSEVEQETAALQREFWRSRK